MGAAPSTDTGGKRPNSSEMVGSIGPGLFWLLLTGSFMIVLCLIVNLKVIKLKAGPRAGLNLIAALMFGIPFLFFVGSRKEPRTNEFIVEDLEFTYTNYWIRIALLVVNCMVSLFGFFSYVVGYAAKPIQAEFLEDDLESFDPRTHIYR